MKNIYYWSPCLNPVGTIKSTLNSAIALSKFNKNYNIKIINACGEWNNHKNIFEKNSIEVIDLSFNYLKFLPKRGYLNSRIAYIAIILLSFFPLIKVVKTKKA